MSEHELLRSSFNAAATLYDRVRPGYPPEIIDAIVALAALPPTGKILEVGCGTGQITLPFAKRGYTILALEPGDALAALAAQNCRSYPQVTITQTTFEAWPVQAAGFDLLLSAQAFHWVDPAFGCAKAAAALRSGGAVALVWNLDVSQQTAFYQASQPLYDAYFPATTDSGTNTSLAAQANRCKATLTRSADFADLHEIRHPWSTSYAAADYLDLLHTYSDHRLLPEPNKTGFFQAIEALIARFGGVVPCQYETLLLLARRR
ncbi:MAG: class I SAM-dependent methyltransferase [Chloroflexales bacterium]|nr:class I SAM-dependent methyltransferase [Chloroflexales bacterium]